MKKVKPSYFDQEYWEDGTKSGYSLSTYAPDNYLHGAKASFMAKLYSGGGRWLEAGCSFGYTVKALVDIGIDCYGFDISKWAIKNSPVKDRVKCFDGLKQKVYKENEFDVIFSFETAEHVPQDKVNLWSLNLYYWLKPGGKLFMTICPGHDNYRGLGDNDESHQTLQPREFWYDLFESCGFVIDNESFIKAKEIEVFTQKMKENRTAPEILIPHYNWNHFCYQKP